MRYWSVVEWLSDFLRLPLSAFLLCCRPQQSRAEAAAEAVKKGLAAAGSKDPAAAAALEKQLLKPLSDQVAALKSAAGDKAKAKDLNKLLPDLQATLKQATGEVTKMAQGKGADVAAVMEGLTGELSSLSATAGAATQSLTNSLAKASPDEAVDALVVGGSAGLLVLALVVVCLWRQQCLQLVVGGIPVCC